MGHGIAQTVALAGGQVRAFDTNVNDVENLHSRIARNLKVMVEAEAIPEVDLQEVLGRITCCHDERDALTGVDFVVEAIAEDLKLKQAFFSR